MTGGSSYGQACIAAGLNATAGGQGARAGATNATCYGQSSAANPFAGDGTDGTAFGQNSGVEETGGCAFGQNSFVPTGHVNAGAIGRDSISTASQRFTLGRVGGTAQQIQELQISGGFAANGAVPQTAPSVTGSRGGNAALASLLTVLDAIGLITDNTTA
jgi:hypothetical protein